jgi:hypothetical protein
MLWFDSLESVSKLAHAPPIGTIAELPAGLVEKRDLLAELASSLTFPPYFGSNWDALEECLGDLSWLPEGAVSIVHRDLPLVLHASDRDTYLEILSTTEMAWPARGRELVLIFPKSVAVYVRAFW